MRTSSYPYAHVNTQRLIVSLLFASRQPRDRRAQFPANPSWWYLGVSLKRQNKVNSPSLPPAFRWHANGFMAEPWWECRLSGYDISIEAMVSLYLSLQELPIGGRLSAVFSAETPYKFRSTGVVPRETPSQLFLMQTSAHARRVVFGLVQSPSVRARVFVICASQSFKSILA